MCATRWTRRISATAALLAIAAARPILAQGEVLHRFSGTSDFASIVTSGQLGDTLTRLTVLISRGRGQSENAAFLRYDIVKCVVPTNSCTRVESGFGEIPRTDVSGSANGTLRVLTDTRAEVNPTFNRFVGSGGVVDVTWTTTGELRPDTEFNGVQVTGSLGLFTRSSGRQVTARGEAEGSVVGVPARLDVFTAVMSAIVGMSIEIVVQDQE